jgi:hypothetical protein
LTTAHATAKKVAAAIAPSISGSNGGRRNTSRAMIAAPPSAMP